MCCRVILLQCNRARQAGLFAFGARFSWRLSMLLLLLLLLFGPAKENNLFACIATATAKARHTAREIQLTRRSAGKLLA